MDKELETLLAAHDILTGAFRAAHGEDSPDSVKTYVWRVRNHVSDRIAEHTLRAQQP